MIDLLGYKIASIKAEQVVTRVKITSYQIWEASYSVHTAGAVDALRELRRQRREHEISSDFDVFLDSDHLTYYKPSCSADEINARFFLHVHPADVNDLPQERRESGFDNLDFNLWQNGGRVGDECVARVDLPRYEIAEVRTGQFTPKGKIWEGSIGFSEQVKP